MPYKDSQAQREYQRTWIANRKTAWFENKQCVDCGSSEDLELDHVDPDEKVSHRVWSWTESKREAELSKCVPRCHNCHAAKTYTHRSDHTTHGTASMYQYHGCRCSECKTWKSDSDKLYR